jgi:hypothetical protein
MFTAFFYAAGGAPCHFGFSSAIVKIKEMILSKKTRSRLWRPPRSMRAGPVRFQNNFKGECENEKK